MLPYDRAGESQNLASVPGPVNSLCDRRGSRLTSQHLRLILIQLAGVFEARLVFLLFIWHPAVDDVCSVYAVDNNI